MFNIVPQWSGLGELVLIWSKILVVRLTIFMVSVSHDSWRLLVLLFQGSGKMRSRTNYMKWDEEDKKHGIPPLLFIIPT
jgi:hypothetical protein